MKVLLAGDEELNRKLLRHFLERIAHCEIEEATNGQEAIDLLRGQTFDLFVTDFEMPIKNGIDVILSILGSGVGDTEIIVVSGNLLKFMDELSNRAENYEEILERIYPLPKPLPRQIFNSIVQKCYRRISNDVG